MAFDFKKEYKELDIPKNKPQIVNVPKMNYIAIRGKGNPSQRRTLNGLWLPPQRRKKRTVTAPCF